MIHIRRAGPLDAGAMVPFLERALQRGGALFANHPPSAAILRDAMALPRAIWHLAEDEDGALIGIQWLTPTCDLTPEAMEIATLIDPNRPQVGIGSALFEKTHSAAKRLQAQWIVATLRAENHGALTYYQSRGFEPVRKGSRDPSRVQMRFEIV